MNIFQVNLECIQHVVSLALTVDLSDSGLMGLVGRNGSGKTTLVRALRNLGSADTFVKTATPHAFSSRSRIIYTMNNNQVEFYYDEKIRSLNCKSPIPSEMRELIWAELPMPHGNRFNYFKSASEADLDIRRAIALGTGIVPRELIDFMSSIYRSDRYSRLVEVSAKGKSYFAIVSEDGKYIREDYLSSGEYFLINLYRTIKSNSRIIAIDEIDISLDSAAQTNLASWLRNFCGKYNRKLIFTTHSLAMMRQLEAQELFYINEDQGRVSIEQMSYSCAKARLFGFVGWDRYILTEDEVLAGFVESLIRKCAAKIFFSYKILAVGGGSQVVSLLDHNRRDQFLTSSERVVAILDGDQKNEKYASYPGVRTVPIESVEKEFYARRSSDIDFPFHYDRAHFSGEKDFYKYIIQKQIATKQDIAEYLIRANGDALQSILQFLREFLSPEFASIDV